MSLLLTLKIFHTFFSVSIVDFKQGDVCWDTADTCGNVQTYSD